MKYEEAKNIIGATCAVQEDKTKVWQLEPTDPVVCLPDQDDPFYWFKRRGADECKHGGQDRP